MPKKSVDDVCEKRQVFREYIFFANVATLAEIRKSVNKISIFLEFNLLKCEFVGILSKICKFANKNLIKVLSMRC